MKESQKIVTLLSKAAENRGGIYALSKATGIPHSWLYKFKNGQIKSPGHDRAKLILDYFESLEQQNSNTDCSHASA